MKKLLVLFALASLSGLLIGCQSADPSRTTPPPVSTAPAEQTSEQAAAGLACARCGCVKFEPQADLPEVCRMCWHAKSEHTRKVR